VEITAGLEPGDVVVTDGSFFVRAERERLGLTPVAASVPGASPAETPTTDRGRADIQSATIVVNERGLEPAKVALRAGTPARLTFIRTTDNTCGTEVVFPSLGIKRALPLNEAVVIELTPPKTGEIGFACGMNMLKGMVVVE
jgi:plastocyanin domain-containing protein